ncbi:MAG: hypothetical protein M1831_005751 [Alyxoria varia]|nr:MAG: hypothetical protein M1831_005751 [Alyxoria varia]
MQYLIRLVQVHESFRVPEIRALAVLAGVDIQIVHYNDQTPFCIVDIPSEAGARAFISRSILSHGIYELWASGSDEEALREAAKNRGMNKPAYKNVSFGFFVDSFQGKSSPQRVRDLVESFSFLAFDGPIKLNSPELELCIFEEYERHNPSPRMMYLGRFVGKSDRETVLKFDLKKRRYISRTSMDAELSLVAANLTLAGPGKLMYDPFVGTGSFAVTCSHFGAMAFGSDLDGRSIRGSHDRNLHSNFVQYGLQNNLLDNFIADLTNSPLRLGRYINGIICDPPYGVREGPKVLGYRYDRQTSPILRDGIAAHLQDGYIPPKRPYGFDDLMQDVLEFGYSTLVDQGRLSLWMPTADEDATELALPTHPGFELVSVCVQQFTKWARRLLTYERRPGYEVATNRTSQRERSGGKNANDLNPFRKKVQNKNVVAVFTRC